MGGTNTILNLAWLLAVQGKSVYSKGNFVRLTCRKILPDDMLHISFHEGKTKQGFPWDSTEPYRSHTGRILPRVFFLSTWTCYRCVIGCTVLEIYLMPIDATSFTRGMDGGMLVFTTTARRLKFLGAGDVWG